MSTDAIKLGEITLAVPIPDQAIIQDALKNKIEILEEMRKLKADESSKELNDYDKRLDALMAIQNGVEDK